MDLLQAGGVALRAGPGVAPGRLIRDLRRGANVSQEALARAAGMRPAQLSLIESGRADPRSSQVVRLLEALLCAPVLHARGAGYIPRCISDE